MRTVSLNPAIVTAAIADGAVTDPKLGIELPVFFFPGSAAGATTSTLFAANHFGVPQGTESAVQFATSAFTATRMSFWCAGTALATDTVTCTLRKNGVDTAITFVIPAGTAPGTVVTDGAHSVNFAAGDLISIKLVQSGTTAQGSWSPRFMVYGK